MSPDTITATRPAPAQRVLSRLPSTVNRPVRALAIASLVSQILIVLTGGAVRLTASGLGCPTWPRCTADSFVNTPEMGMHGVIEFGNRLLTFLLAAIALALLVSLLRMRRDRKDLFRLAVALLAGIPAQAVVGGITVWTQLNPWVVGCHFVVSMVLITLATLLVNRARSREEIAARRPAVRAGRTIRQLLVAIGIFTALAVLLGVVVTGSGPHAGDAAAPRNGLDSYLLTRIHVAPVYLLVIATAAALVLVYRRRQEPRLRRALTWLGAAVLAQGAIGYLQHFTGLPVVLVALHLLGASVLVAAAANAIDAGFQRPAASVAGGATPPADR